MVSPVVRNAAVLAALALAGCGFGDDRVVGKRFADCLDRQPGFIVALGRASRDEIAVRAHDLGFRLDTPTNRFSIAVEKTNDQAKRSVERYRPWQGWLVNDFERDDNVAIAWGYPISHADRKAIDSCLESSR